MSVTDQEIEEVVDYYGPITGIHPACEASPLLAPEDAKVLSSAIKSHGLRNEIRITKDGLLVDGRHRLVYCYQHSVEPRFKVVRGDPWACVWDNNFAHRSPTVGQRAMFANRWREEEDAAAKQRMADAVSQTNKGRKDNIPSLGNVTQAGAPVRARQKIAEKVGVGGSSIDKARDVKEFAPDLAPQVISGESTLESAHRVAKERKKSKQKPAMPKVTDEKVIVITDKGKKTKIAKPKKVVFNKTNDSVDWASWTWNPVTGCNHGCTFCYAREIANSQRMAPYYPNKFKPTFHEYRLDAPANTNVPESDVEQDGRVFVCSMADLFGKWVPKEWIQKVFKACLASPQWEYLFLTKWPARYSQMPLLEKAWYGSSVIKQADVKRVEKAMTNFDCDGVKWISLEPMLGPIKFNDLSWCDLVVIGSQTSTNQPDGFEKSIPAKFDHVMDVVLQCREAGVPYYLKENLGTDQPGMELPKQPPRRKA